MRIVMENLPKKELNGQTPVVTPPTKQALNLFESQQKTRPTPPVPSNTQKQMGGGPMGMNNPNIPPQGMMQNPNMPPQGMNPRMMNPNPMGMRQGNHMQRMPGPPGPMSGHPNGPQMNNMPPRFQNSNWNNGPPRPPNGIPPNSRPMMQNPQGPPMGAPMNRPPMGGPMNMRPFGPSRPQMHFNQGIFFFCFYENEKS
jgi:cleavage and polyadenylation specificity factor subunit 6/7